MLEGGFLSGSVVLLCRISVPQPGTEPAPSAVKAWSVNPWTAKKFPSFFYFKMREASTEGEVDDIGEENIISKIKQTYFSFLHIHAETFPPQL